jgi:hypothetical protein
MFTAYLLVKLLHVLGAILGVGITITFGIIMARAAAQPAVVPFALETIETLSKVSTAGFLTAIVTGLLMGHLGALSFTALWFSASIGIAAIALALGTGVARPTLQKQIALAKQGPEALPELRRLGARSRKVGMVLAFLSLSLICLMIFKPTL